MNKLIVCVAIMLALPIVGCSSSTSSTRLCLDDKGKFTPCPITEFANVKPTAENVMPTEMQNNFDQSNKFQRYQPRFDNKRLAHYVEQLAMDLVGTDHQDKLAGDIAIATFVKFDGSLRQASPLGNQIAELFYHELQQFGYEIVDLKNNDFIDSTARGDFNFSRDNKRMPANGNFKHVLSGTLIYDKRGVLVNTRLTHIESKRVIASASEFIPKFVIE